MKNNEASLPCEPIKVTRRRLHEQHAKLKPLEMGMQEHIARTNTGQKKNYAGMSFGVRGFFVSTVGTIGEVVRVYIRDQEKEKHRIIQRRFLAGDHRMVVSESF